MSNEEHSAAPVGHLSARKYLIGFGLAVVLTGVSFAIAAAKGGPTTGAIVGLVVAAVVQIFVHLHFFLHLDRSSAMRWNVIAIAFTALILFIFIAGTVWVMLTLNSRMMG